MRMITGTAAIGTAMLAAVLAAACGTTEAEKAPVAASAAVQIGPENVVSVEQGTIVVGPTLSGELRPQRDAKIRAELGGSMLEVHVEEGQTVMRGALLGRIETRTLDDARQSASSAVRNAENQLAVARREVERTEKLVNAGAIAARDLDLTKSQVSAVEAQLADAKARLASAERQLGDAVIRAPIGETLPRICAPGTQD